MNAYMNKIIGLLDDVSCNQSVDNYFMILQDIIDECQGRIETMDYEEDDYEITQK